MFVLTELLPEKNKKYFVYPGKDFATNKWKITYQELKALGEWKILNLKNKKYLITKPTLYDYIMFWLKRQTQIIYPQDSYQILNLLSVEKDNLVFESWIWSGALSLVLLNVGVKLISFEKKEEFINLAKSNISMRENFKNIKFNHAVYQKNIIEDDFDDFKDFFDKGILDIKEPEKALKNSKLILKKGGILIIWVPTTNQVEKVLKNAKENNFWIDKIYTLTLNERIRIEERFRPEDWQPWFRGFIIKLIKYEQ